MTAGDASDPVWSFVDVVDKKDAETKKVEAPKLSAMAAARGAFAGTLRS